MTKGQAKPLIGQIVSVIWRDPLSDPAWTPTPLEMDSACAETTGQLCGFNGRGELVVAGSHTTDGAFGDRTVIPLSLIEGIVPLAPCGEPVMF